MHYRGVEVVEVNLSTPLLYVALWGIRYKNLITSEPAGFGLPPDLTFGILGQLLIVLSP
jgi:hypothetical protein